MNITALGGIARAYSMGVFHYTAATILLGGCTLAYLASLPAAIAQTPPDSNQPATAQSAATAAPANAAAQIPVNPTPANACATPTPSAGKALVCVYRVGRFTGSASHDNLFINHTFLAKLLNGEYASMEVPAGPVIVTGVAKMYYGPSIIMSSAAAVNETRKEVERTRFDADAGTTYYLKWTSGVFGSGITLVSVDAGTGAKELGKLHPSKNTDPKQVAKDEAKDEGKDAGKDAAKDAAK